MVTSGPCPADAGFRLSRNRREAGDWPREDVLTSSVPEEGGWDASGVPVPVPGHRVMQTARPCRAAAGLESPPLPLLPWTPVHGSRGTAGTTTAINLGRVFLGTMHEIRFRI